MGIKSFHSFFRKKTPKAYQQVDLHDLADKYIAVDCSIVMCKNKSSYGNKWLSAFYSMIVKLVNYNINFIFVLDSKVAPVEKSLEKEARGITRKKNKERIEKILSEWYQLDSHLKLENKDLIEPRAENRRTDNRTK